MGKTNKEKFEESTREAFENGSQGSKRIKELFSSGATKASEILGLSDKKEDEKKKKKN